MRRLAVNTLTLAVVLAGVGIGLGQQTGPPLKRKVAVEEEESAKAKTTPNKSKLEEMLAEALKNNPDIRVAAANVALAEAELNRTRLQVTQKVIALHASLLSQKAEVDYRQAQYERFKKLEETKSVSSEIVQEAQQKLAIAKAKLAEIESQMPALLGKTAHAADAKDADAAFERFFAGGMQTTRGFKIQEQPKATGPMADKIRKALETPIAVDYKDMFLADILKDLEKKAPGLSIRDFPRGNKDFKLTLHFKEALPVSAILQALADDTEMSFVVREYGILVTTLNGAPPGAITVQEFLRQKPVDAPRGRETTPRNPPAENVQGVVKQVDSSGLMTISIGSDAGLSKGHTLELFRFTGSGPSQSKYLGTIRIIEVKAKEAVAKPVGRLASPPYVNDQVASRIPGN